jgi:hypothetical protein
MTRFVWAIEELEPPALVREPSATWRLLPNTVQVRRYHCEFDIKMLRQDYPLSRYRIVKYERVK